MNGKIPQNLNLVFKVFVYKELQATEKSCKQKMWSSSKKSTSVHCPEPNVTYENIHTSNTIRIEPVIFRNI